MNETRPELRRILNDADNRLRGLISHLDRILSTPTQSWTYETRKQAMKGLSVAAYGIMEQLGFWMEQNVWIRGIVEIRGVVESVRTNAWHASLSESRIWGRTYLRQDLDKLIKLFGDGCECEMDMGSVDSSQAAQAIKYQFKERNEKPPEYLSVAEVANLLGVSRALVTRHFEHYPGVIDLSEKKDRRSRIRRYRTLRIPRGVLNRFIHERRVR